MSVGYKHLIECRCILTQFSKQEDPPFHKFLVFSVINDDNVVDIKFAQCNNCGAIHKVTDICTSQILNKDSTDSLPNIEDIKVGLNAKLVAILERYKVDLPTYEAVQFVIENERWGEYVTLTSDEIDGVLQQKYVQIMGENIFKIKSHKREVYI